MTATAIRTAERPRTFFGEPPALAYLAFTEAWERFSYYGMTALLTLYMTKALLLPGHVEHIAGFAALRGVLQGLFGAATPLAMASQIFGLYTALVYFTPLLGGLIADRWIGRRNAVAAGAVLMSAGHFAMAFDASFLLALALLILGCGLLKGNIAAQVGQLYPATDDSGRTRGFAIFSTGINCGAVAGPLVCGLLAQIWGWHAGFGAAGVLMLIGLATYLIGYPHLKAASARHVPEPTPEGGGRRRGEARILLALTGVAAITVFQSIAYYQGANIGLIWIDRQVDPRLLGFNIPTAWYNSVDSLASIIFVPVLFGLWRWQARSGAEPNDLGKIAIGAMICMAGNLVLAAASLGGGGLSPLWPVADLILQGIAFLYYWPTLLALVSRTAPARLKSTLMGAAYLSLFASNTIIGRLGGLYETLTPTAFWLLHAAIAAAGAVLAMTVGRPLKRILDAAAAES